MLTEEGIVVGIDAQSAWVQATKSSACEACSSRDSCNVMENGREMKVSAINEAGAKVDDRVLISFETSSLLKASFLIYISPVLGLIAGAFAGEALAPFFHLDPSTGSVIVAILFSLLMVLMIRGRGRKMAEKREYRPKITKILGRVISETTEKKVAK